MRHITINTILGTILNGQGESIVAGGNHTSTLRHLFASIARDFLASAGYLLAVLRGLLLPGLSMRPAMCCLDHEATSQRPKCRWQPGVVVKDGTVGVS